MKIYHWIDKYKAIVSLKIIKKYSRARASGRPGAYCMHYSFWDQYVFRLLLVLSSVITLDKDAYQAFYRIIFNNSSLYHSPNKHSYIYLKIRDIIATLFGYRYYAVKDIFPLLQTKDILRSEIFFTVQDFPLISIIIPIYNQLEYSYNCIKSIQAHVSTAHTFEVIVVDNRSTDQTEIFFVNNVKGITYLRNDKKEGLTNCYSLGVSSSRGQFICFLNNQVQVSENWLEPLVKTLQDKEVGCAGSKITYSNGLLAEAGGIIYQNSSILSYGAYQNPVHPYYNYQREVDYCSAISMLFRKSDLLEVGSFDKKFDQTPYEGIDLCFSIRNILQKKIIYQPLSGLIYFRYGHDCKQVCTDIKKMPDDLSRERFAEKWQNELLSYPQPTVADLDARSYQTGKTILFIDDLIPAPDQDSGSNRLFRLMKIVRSLGYHVIFLPGDKEKRGVYFDYMISEGFEVLYGFPNRKGMIKVLVKTLPYIDAVWLCKPRNNQLFKFIFDLKKDCTWIYDTIDLHFLRLQREGDLTQDQSLLQLAEETKKVEISIAKQADITIAITDNERVILNNELISNVVVIPNIHESEIIAESKFTFLERKGILFIGSYQHSPNVDAAIWLAKHIMPEVWKTDASIKLTLLGSNPTKKILNLQTDNISVPGYIHDVSSYFNHHRIFVSPLRFGAGMKGKIGQSLEYGLPIISTDIGIEGMNLIDGHNVLVANTTQEFADRIIKLYGSSEIWSLIRENSIEAMEEYSPKAVTQKLITLFESLKGLNEY